MRSFISRAALLVNVTPDLPRLARPEHIMGNAGGQRVLPSGAGEHQQTLQRFDAPRSD
jgi:hypothetical protein